MIEDVRIYQLQEKKAGSSDVNFMRKYSTVFIACTVIETTGFYDKIGIQGFPDAQQ